MIRLQDVARHVGLGLTPVVEEVWFADLCSRRHLNGAERDRWDARFCSIGDNAARKRKASALRVEAIAVMVTIQVGLCSIAPGTGWLCASNENCGDPRTLPSCFFSDLATNRSGGPGYALWSGWHCKSRKRAAFCSWPRRRRSLKKKQRQQQMCNNKVLITFILASEK